MKKFEQFYGKESRESEWERKKEELIDRITSSLYPQKMDEEIKEAVFALNAMDLPPVQSCFGHVKEENFPVPIIEIKVPRESEDSKLIGKANELLEEFYRDRDVSPEARLGTRETENNSFLITNKGWSGELLPEELTPEERENVGQNLKEYQKEMKDFAKFLRKKFFEKNGNN